MTGVHLLYSVGVAGACEVCIKRIVDGRLEVQVHHDGHCLRLTRDQAHELADALDGRIVEVRDLRQQLLPMPTC